MRRTLWLLLPVLAACSDGRTVTNSPPVAIVPADINTMPNVMVTLDGSGSSDPDGDIVSWRWNFGDGTSADGAIVEHAWTTEDVFSVQLTVEDDFGATDTAALRVSTSTSQNLNMLPIASFSGPARGMPGETLSFDGSASADPDGSVVEHRWEFGDGATAMGPTVSHAWTTEETFTVKLVVVDDDGALGQATKTVVIGAVTGNQAPIAEAGPDQNGAIGAPVVLDGSASTDPDGTIVSYAWDLGEPGATANTPRAMHTYSAPGTYTVTLTVTDDAGETAQDTATVTIAPPTSYDGNWLLNPTQAVQTCQNSRRTYQIPFPTVRLAMMGTDTAAVTADVTGESRTMMGTVDRNTSPPEISLSWMGSETDAACGTATVRHSFSGTFTTDTTISGRVTVIYNWSDAFCNCSRPFDFTGAKQ